tara:strand:+ start:146 stop:883 length:738 start_codon:yes stop_codon:yes gene_type:complete
MIAIILAAGMGSRLESLTKDIPKCLLKIDNKSLLDIQINSFRKQGINEIFIVTGHCSDKIKTFPNVTKIVNKEYRNTNMVYSLMKVLPIIKQKDIIISYSDIIFERTVLKKLINDPNKNTIVVDKNWKSYWIERYGTSNYDIESLKLEGNTITEIGQTCSSDVGIDARYVGLMKFSYSTVKKMIHIWENKNNLASNSYMTDMIQCLINNSITIFSHDIQGKWYEIDTQKDYMLAKSKYVISKEKY